ncbi:MAG: ATP-binding cassette domain-containing protein [Candidatus Bipolaricaulaceae bacterium]
MLAIQVAELRFATEEGVWVFDGLSFGVAREGFLWVVGPAGSGKTLLLRILLGEIRPHGGQILLLGRNILRISRRKFQGLRRKVGYMPEEPNALFGRTVLGNLQFKLRALGVRGEAAKEGVERALDLAGLRGREDLRPENLNPLELRCLDLALALCPDCSILLADDPLRNLTKEAKEDFLSVLERVNQAGITILATSREDETLLRRGFSQKGGSRGLVYLREGLAR